MDSICVGRDFDIKGSDSIDFSSPQTLLEFDLVIWDPTTVFHEYLSWEPKRYRGHYVLDADESVRIEGDRKRRLAEFSSLLRMGKTIVVFVPPPDLVYVDSGERRYSGTGKNQAATTIVNQLSLSEFLPLGSDFGTQEASGRKAELRGEGVLADLWSALQDDFFYKAHLTRPLGQPFLFIRGTDKAVGALVRQGMGNLLLLPHLATPNQYQKKSHYEAAAKNFLKAVVETAQQLSRGTGETGLPAWVKDYHLPGEKKLIGELDELQEMSRHLDRSAAQKREEIADLESYKRLISGKGIPLQQAVLRVFEDLGLDAKEGPTGRDDIIFTYEDRVAVVEVKGTKSSAAEAHAAQLEKWVSRYYEENAVYPKGILIVNAFCDTPFSERTEDAFPNQMLKYCVGREHCLMTTTQLLGVLLHAKEHPETRQKVLSSLLSTTGILSGFSLADYLEDWKTSVPVA